MEPIKKYYTLGCCGIDCGLCPRYYTEGDSKCPGCFGIDFAEKHPSCSFANCCMKKHGLESCGQCGEFPCQKYENKNIEKDSFVTHKRMIENLHRIKQHGIEKYIAEQKIRINMLEEILRDYNDGKSKSYFCLAVRLLNVQDLHEAIEKTKNTREDSQISKTQLLKNMLEEYAKNKNIEIRLMK